MSIENFRLLADYNHWANRRIYAAALAMPEEPYRRSTGVFFGSLHGTLNHLLLTDRVWLKRLTGEGDHPKQLNAILFEDRQELARARMAEDARLIRVIDRLWRRRAYCALLLPDDVRRAATAGAQGHSATSVQSPDPPSRPRPCLLFDRDR